MGKKMPKCELMNKDKKKKSKYAKTERQLKSGIFY